MYAETFIYKINYIFSTYKYIVILKYIIYTHKLYKYNYVNISFIYKDTRTHTHDERKLGHEFGRQRGYR